MRGNVHITPIEAEWLISHTRAWETRQRRAKRQQNAIVSGFMQGLLLIGAAIVIVWGMFALTGQ